MKLFSKWLQNKERGQAILIIALAMVGLIAFIGLMTDGGVLLIEYGKLKRGVDAGAIASVQQFRRGFNGADLEKTALNFLALNGVTFDPATDNILVFRCILDNDGNPVSQTQDENGDLVPNADGTYPDPDLCTAPLRKLVRVEAEKLVRFGFLNIIGIESRTITATSVAEAASIDLVLVIDTSASMAYDTFTGEGATASLNVVDAYGAPVDVEDPAVCNASSSCQPLEAVKDVALDFLDNIYFPYDRVAVVAFTGQAQDGTANRDHVTMLPLSDNQSAVQTAISNLKVFRPPDCSDDGNLPSPDSPTDGLCRNVDSGVFKGYECPRYRHSDNEDLSSCNSSNIGGALNRAWAEYTSGIVRSDAVWVTILLAGGPANATDVPEDDMAIPKPPLGWTPEPGFYPFGYCPSTSPPCRDGDGDTRHSEGSVNYDADDYARDIADSVADPDTGGGITIYTIGLGNLIQNAPSPDPNEAEDLLNYIATLAGDPGASHGLYFYAPNSNELQAIFAKIANDIFTKIAK